MFACDYILHGSWSHDQFFAWAETSRAPRKPRGAGLPVPLHPFAASETSLRIALQEASPRNAGFSASRRAQRVILLPSDAHAPQRSAWLSPDDEEPANDLHLAPWRVNGLALDMLTALDLLVGLPLTAPDQHWCGADLRYWGLAARVGLECLAQHRYIPGLEEDKSRYRAVWTPVLSDPGDQARLRALAQAMPPACRALFKGVKPPEPAAAPASHDLLDSFIAALVDQTVRAWGAAHLNRRRKPPDGVAGLWWAALWDAAARLPGKAALDNLYAAWRAWVGQLQQDAEAAFRLCFRLEPPAVDEDGQPTSSDWSLHYMLQATDDPSLLTSIEPVWRSSGGALDLLTRTWRGAQEKVLAGLGLAARLFPPIEASLRAARPTSCTLSVDEAYAFLREAAPLLESSGFRVLLPPWWTKPSARLRVKAQLKTDANIIGHGILNMDALVHFDWQVALGDELMSRDELERLAALKVPLVRVRGQWVLLQADEIETAISFWKKKRSRDDLRLRDALGLALGAVTEVEGLPFYELDTQGPLSELLQQLDAGARPEPLPTPEQFVGQLRPYQERGFAWLAFMRRWGLGACLADDMGLGKTIQTIALLLRERETTVEPLPPALLICPTSVVGNWQREIQRFAPNLRVLSHHGADRAQGETLRSLVQDYDVVISTFGLARRDVSDLTQVQWSDLILDEAQNIKNPHAKQTQAIRSLPAANRIALTGTPVENRLSELWSIMQFLNPGLLGAQNAFRQDFALPIERYQDADAAARLKKLVGPFVLRRVKTDPTIIQDLPDKTELKVYCTLTPEQTTLYEAVAQEALERIEGVTQGIERRGIVLGLLMRLKQVCNHPAQFLGDGSALAERSGKLERLREMLEEVLDVGDQALIFTQFAEMGHLLQRHLSAEFGREVLYLHGGTPQKQRDRMVARFQQRMEGGPATGAPPLLILSLRAGGTGLNLTAANHVFHFDRWWNPAVENQATDRAFRIGQTRDVLVHKLVCLGTLEERIDELIEAKKALADSVVGSGEGWLTELSTDALHDLLALRCE